MVVVVVKKALCTGPGGDLVLVLLIRGKFQKFFPAFKYRWQNFCNRPLFFYLLYILLFNINVMPASLDVVTCAQIIGLKAFGITNHEINNVSKFLLKLVPKLIAFTNTCP